MPIFDGSMGRNLMMRRRSEKNKPSHGLGFSWILWHLHVNHLAQGAAALAAASWDCTSPRRTNWRFKRTIRKLHRCVPTSNNRSVHEIKVRQKRKDVPLIIILTLKICLNAGMDVAIRSVAHGALHRPSLPHSPWWPERCWTKVWKQWRCSH